MKSEIKMAQLNVEIPEDLKRAIKSTAANDGVSLQNWTIAALRDASKTEKDFNSAKSEKIDKAISAVVFRNHRKPRNAK